MFKLVFYVKDHIIAERKTELLRNWIDIGAVAEHVGVFAHQEHPPALADELDDGLLLFRRVGHGRVLEKEHVEVADVFRGQVMSGVQFEVVVVDAWQAVVRNEEGVPPNLETGGLEVARLVGGSLRCLNLGKFVASSFWRK